jgi:exopolysaccharide biosynthesis protein
MIGVAGDRRVWLITVDGRNKTLSLGMSFAELQGLARRVGLVDALNLDGGGSTTMVVNGAVMNHPSDPTGPRKVSDAIVIR